MIDASLPVVTDEMLAGARATSTPFTVAILRAGPRFAMPGPDRNDEVTSIIWAHGKRNTALHLAGFLPVVCPIADGSGVAGVGIFAADETAVAEILDGDPAIRAGVLTYELHPTRTFTIAAAKT
ncbi:MAG TPA: hypothetical protein VGJ46_11865 [Candidatus Limnocylindrales bacterium]|jgi:hypothetical protein